MSEFPFDIVAHITTFLPPKDALEVVLTCRAVRSKVDAVYRHRGPVSVHVLFRKRVFGVFTHVKGVSDDRLHQLKPRLFQAIQCIEFDEEQDLFEFHWPPNIQRVIRLPPSIPICLLPASLLNLQFHILFDDPITYLPPGLEVLEFGISFNHPLDSSIFPNTLKILWFGDFFDQPIEHLSFPNTLEEIHFGFFFIQPVHQVKWPKNIRVIEFGQHFNQPLTNLPVGIQELTLGAQFHQIHLQLPDSLITLHFGCKDQILEHLPKRLQTLRLGYHFQQPIHRLRLPSTLECIASRDTLTPETWYVCNLTEHVDCELQDIVSTQEIQWLSYRKPVF